MSQITSNHQNRDLLAAEAQLHRDLQNNDPQAITNFLLQVSKAVKPGGPRQAGINQQFYEELALAYPETGQIVLINHAMQMLIRQAESGQALNPQLLHQMLRLYHESILSPPLQVRQAYEAIKTQTSVLTPEAGFTAEMFPARLAECETKNDINQIYKMLHWVRLDAFSYGKQVSPDYTPLRNLLHWAGEMLLCGLPPNPVTLENEAMIERKLLAVMWFIYQLPFRREEVPRQILERLEQLARASERPSARLARELEHTLTFWHFIPPDDHV